MAKSTSSQKVGGLSAQLTPLFRPQRSRYVKGQKKLNCVFCLSTPAKPNFKNLCVFETVYSRVLLNKYPYNSGHILIIPKRHTGDLQQLNPEEYLDLMQLLKLSDLVLKKVYQPAGINWGLNQGAAAGAGIPDHLHFHMIPRWPGDLNFLPLVAQSKVLIEDLKVSYSKLQLAFKKA